MDMVLCSPPLEVPKPWKAKQKEALKLYIYIYIYIYIHTYLSRSLLGFRVKALRLTELSPKGLGLLLGSQGLTVLGGLRMT